MRLTDPERIGGLFPETTSLRVAEKLLSRDGGARPVAVIDSRMQDGLTAPTMMAAGYGGAGAAGPTVVVNERRPLHNLMVALFLARNARHVESVLLMGGPSGVGEALDVADVDALVDKLHN